MNCDTLSGFLQFCLSTRRRRTLSQQEVDFLYQVGNQQPALVEQTVRATAARLIASSRSHGRSKHAVFGLFNLHQFQHASSVIHFFLKVLVAATKPALKHFGIPSERQAGNNQNLLRPFVWTHLVMIPSIKPRFKASYPNHVSPVAT